MKDLTNAALIKCKGLLFLFLGLASGTMLIVENLSWKNVLFLIICVWSFCRAYYCAFYVIEKYVDGNYRFSGLGSFLQYLLRKQPERRCPKAAG